MKLTQILTVLCMSFVTFFSQAKTTTTIDSTTHVMVKTELASPIVLED